MAEAGIPDLINALKSVQGTERQRARSQLVTLGQEAVPPLTDALLSGGDKHTIWELTKALADIGSPDAAPALLTALAHKDSDIRWLAAEGLVRLGRTGLQQVLLALESDTGVARFRDGVHHVLHDLVQDFGEIVSPVLDALKSPAADDLVPLTAREALRKLD